MAKSPKKPRRGGEHDPAVNTAAGAPSKGVSVDPAVNTAAGAPSMQTLAVRCKAATDYKDVSFLQALNDECGDLVPRRYANVLAYLEQSATYSFSPFKTGSASSPTV